MSLIAHYKFENNTADSNGRYIGKPSRSMTYYDGKIGKSIGFDFSSRIDTDIPDSPNDLSFSLWFKKSSSSWNQFSLIGCRYSDTGWMLYRNSGDDDGYLRWYSHYVSSTGTIKSYNSWPGFSNLDTDRWYHIVICRRHDGVTHLYLDGQISSEEQPPSNFVRWSVADPYKVSIGAERTGSSSWNAFGIELDDVRIYDHFLSKKEVLDLSKGLCFHYALNQELNHHFLDLASDGTVPIDSNSPPSTSLSVKKLGNTSFVFNGTDKYIKIPNSCLTVPSGEEMSICFWYKWVDAGDQDHPIIAKNPNSGWTPINGFVIGHGWGSMIYIGIGDNYLNYELGINQDQWYFFTFTYKDGVGVKLYLNGELIYSSSTQSGLIGSNTEDMYIGRANYRGGYFKGNINDIRIYATMISSEYIENLYHQRAVLDKNTKNLTSYIFTDSPNSNESINITIRSRRDSDVNYSEILVDNIDYSRNHRGHNFAIFDLCGNLVSKANFDTHGLSDYWIDGTYITDDIEQPMIEYLNRWTEKYFIAIATKDQGSNIPQSCLDILREWGFEHDINYRDAWVGLCKIGDFIKEDHELYDQNKIATIYNPILEKPKIDRYGIIKSPFISECGNTDGLSIWYQLKNDTYDIINDRYATIHGPSLSSRGYSFNGDGDYIDFGNTDSFNSILCGDVEWTICYWCNPISDGRILDRGDTGVDPTGSMELNVYSIRINNESDTTSSMPSITGTGWNHVCLTRHTSGLHEWYLNGQFVTSSTPTNVLNYGGTGTWKMGRRAYDNSNDYEGDITDLRIYNRILSSKDVAVLYMATNPFTETSMKQMDDGIYVGGEFKEIWT